MARKYDSKANHTLNKILPKSAQYLLEDLYFAADKVEARAYALGAGWNEENYDLYDKARQELFTITNDILKLTDTVVKLKSQKVVNEKANKEVYWYKIVDRPARDFLDRDLSNL
jgi:hypothetical protein